MCTVLLRLSRFLFPGGQVKLEIHLFRSKTFRLIELDKNFPTNEIYLVYEITDLETNEKYGNLFCQLYVN